MTQIFSEEGAVLPVTVLSVMPMTVITTKNTEKDGYNAVQIGAGTRKDKNVSKAVKGQLKDMALPEVIKEYRTAEVGDLKKGDTISLEAVKVGDFVTVSAISKGKGFQGVVKRHGFHGGPRSHGQKHSEREPGSIGGGGRAGGRVIKGMRMAGRMGGERVTVKNLMVAGIDAESNTVMLRGAVPGRRGTIVEVRSMNPARPSHSGR